MQSGNVILNTMGTVSGERVIAQALSNSQLRISHSDNGKYAAVWRTYAAGKPKPDDGKFWLLERLGDSDEYIVIYERLVFYANNVAVANNGYVAWVRGETHTQRIQDFEFLDIHGDYIVEAEKVGRCKSWGCSFAFSPTGKTIGYLNEDDAPANNRAFAWSTETGRKLAAFPLLLLGHTNDLSVTDEMISVSCRKDPETLVVTHAFDGSIIKDTRFDKASDYTDFRFRNSYGIMGLGNLPVDQLYVFLNGLNVLIRSKSFPTQNKEYRDHVRSVRSKILNMLGESEVIDTSLTLTINGDLYNRLNDYVSTSKIEDNPEGIVLKLLTKALDLVELR